MHINLLKKLIILNAKSFWKQITIIERHRRKRTTTTNTLNNQIQNYTYTHMPFSKYLHIHIHTVKIPYITLEWICKEKNPNKQKQIELRRIHTTLHASNIFEEKLNQKLPIQNTQNARNIQKKTFQIEQIISTGWKTIHHPRLRKKHSK